MKFKLSPLNFVRLIFIGTVIALLVSILMMKEHHDPIALTIIKNYYKFKYKNYNTLPLCNDNIIGKQYDLLNPIQVWAKILHVHDGDTFDAIFELPQSPMRNYTIRHQPDSQKYMINSPEVNLKNERIKGHESKKVVEDMILNKIVHLKIYGSDVYGRLLASVNVDNIMLDEFLVQCNYAKLQVWQNS